MHACFVVFGKSPSTTKGPAANCSKPFHQDPHYTTSITSPQKGLREVYLLSTYIPYSSSGTHAKSYELAVEAGSINKHDKIRQECKRSVHSTPWRMRRILSLRGGGVMQSLLRGAPLMADRCRWRESLEIPSNKRNNMEQWAKGRSPWDLQNIPSQDFGGKQNLSPNASHKRSVRKSLASWPYPHCGKWHCDGLPLCSFAAKLEKSV